MNAVYARRRMRPIPNVCIHNIVLDRLIFFCFNNIKTSFCYCRCVSTSGAAALHVLHQVNRSTRGSHSSGQCVSIVFGYRLTKLYGKSRARGWHTWYFPNRHAHVAPISPVQLSWTFFRCFGKLFNHFIPASSVALHINDFCFTFNVCGRTVFWFYNKELRWDGTRFRSTHRLHTLPISTHIISTVRIFIFGRFDEIRAACR